jgi:hypothetical protein
MFSREAILKKFIIKDGIQNSKESKASIHSNLTITITQKRFYILEEEKKKTKTKNVCIAAFSQPAALASLISFCCGTSLMQFRRLILECLL